MSNKSYVKYKDKHKIIDNQEYKWCPDCDNWFLMNEENFKIYPSKKDGYSDKCISCQEIYAHQRYMNNRDKELEKAKRRQRENIDKILEYEKQYYRDHKEWKQNHNEKYFINNKEKRQQYMSEYQQNNSEKIKQYSKKRRIKNHIITDDEWIACKDYFKNENGEWACAYCGKPATENIRKYKGELKQFDLEKEHVIDEGRNDIKNCIPSCTTCNSKKKQKTLNEFYNPKNKNYTYKRYHKIYMWIRYDCKNFNQKKKLKRKYNRKS